MSAFRDVWVVTCAIHVSALCWRNLRRVKPIFQVLLHNHMVHMQGKARLWTHVNSLTCYRTTALGPQQWFTKQWSIWNCIDVIMVEQTTLNHQHLGNLPLQPNVFNMTKLYDPNTILYYLSDTLRKLLHLHSLRGVGCSSPMARLAVLLAEEVASLNVGHEHAAQYRFSRAVRIVVSNVEGRV